MIASTLPCLQSCFWTVLAYMISKSGFTALWPLSSLGAGIRYWGLDGSECSEPRGKETFQRRSPTLVVYLTLGGDRDDRDADHKRKVNNLLTIAL